MYLSYFQHPELQLLDSDRCEDYVMSPKCELMTLMRAHLTGDFEKAPGDDDRQEIADGLEDKLADGMLADMIDTVYMPSPAFEAAMEKSSKAFEDLMGKPSVLAEVHENCCFVVGKNRQIKIFIFRTDGDSDECREYCMTMTMYGRLRLWAGYEFEPAKEKSACTFVVRTDETDAEHDFYKQTLGEDYNTADVLWMWLMSTYGYLVFKRYSDVEIETVARQKTLKKSTILREKVNNFMGINVQLLDSHWFTTICRDEGFAVSGHFRLQPYKDGSRKLIYIAPFVKHGYHRQARIENEKE
jgi:hypothetical protein